MTKASLVFSAMLSGAALLCGAPARAETPALQRGDVEAIIKDYLLTHPDVLRDAMLQVDRKQKADEEAARQQAVADRASLIFDSPRQAVIGNPKGKITLVEFFDYNCGYCKKTLDDMTRLLRDEPNMRLVIKDFPVLGPGSVEAAEIATALRAQFKGDKYWQFHQRLLAMHGQIGKAQALSVAKDMGADMDRLAKDVADPATHASINEVMDIADKLQLTGTPSFVVGKEIVVGAVGYDELKKSVDNVGKCGKTNCDG